MTITASQTTVIKGDVNNNGIKDAGEIWVGDLDNDLAIDPGETVTTTVTISNTAGPDATGVSFNETLNGMTQVNQTGDDINVSPLAFNETYSTFGNTPLEVGVTASGVPAVRVTNAATDSVLDNDVEFFSDAGQFIISQINGVAFTPGAAVNFAERRADDERERHVSALRRAPGFTGTRGYACTLGDAGLDDVASNKNNITGTGTVTIDVTAPKVWYINNASLAEPCGGEPALRLVNWRMPNGGTGDGTPMTTSTARTTSSTSRARERTTPLASCWRPASSSSAAARLSWSTA